MTDAAPVLLLTRPEKQSLRFAAMVEAQLGPVFRPIISPLLDIVTIAGPISTEGVGALVFTSENGVQSFLARSDVRNIPAWCVGNRTQDVARQGGLDARSANGDLDALLALLTAENVPTPVLYLHGETQHGDLAAMLNARGIETYERVVYRQQARPLSADAVAALTGKDRVVVPLFSARTAQLFRATAEALGATPTVIALSAAVAENMRGWGGGQVAVAASPDAKAMIALLANQIAAGRSA
jgi:uroporphyrinogen-III synthase